MSDSNLQRFQQAVTQVVGSQHVLDANRLSLRNRGWCSTSLGCGILIRPADTGEIAKVCKLAQTHGVGLVPHGGLTGLADATHSEVGQAVLSCERLDKVLRVDATQAVLVAQSGVTLEAANAAAAAHGMMLGVDIPSRGSCTLGGMIATNAGGVRVIRYGMTRDNVIGLEAVLSDGRVVSAMNTLMKNNTGFDLKQLFIGSEGTLGVVTQAVFKLYPKPLLEHTAIIATNSLAQIEGVLQRCRRELGAGLLSFELVWQDYYRVTTSQPGFGVPPLAADYPYYGIVETGSWTNRQEGAALESVLEAVLEEGLVRDAVIAQSGVERAAIWRSREDSEAVSDASSYCLNYDVGFETADIEAFVSQTRAAISQRWPAAVVNYFGHIGDGNLHVMIGVEEQDYAEREQIDALVYSTVASFDRSTVSAEHGIGLTKLSWLMYSRSQAEIELMHQLRQCLDPTRILNSGKVTP